MKLRDIVIAMILLALCWFAIFSITAGFFTDMVNNGGLKEVVDTVWNGTGGK